MTDKQVRYALYVTPPRGTPLDRFGASVLGYDAYTGEAVARPDWPDVEAGALDAITAEPRRYGFHGTLKAPFRLAEGCTSRELMTAMRAFAATRPVVPLGRLALTRLGAFIALTPIAPAKGIDLLAAECVATFDPFRASLDPMERARRHAAGLTPRQAALLDRWGYPYVFEEFRFHMTLTGSLPPDAIDVWSPRLASAFAPIADAEGSIDGITLLRQDAGEPFRVVERFPFTGNSA